MKEDEGLMQPVRRVWILGSGFSRPLGGPLLVDLLSERFRAKVKAKLGHHIDSEAFSDLYDFFEFGKKAKYFDHAEDFLVQLDDRSAYQQALNDLFRRMRFDRNPDGRAVEFSELRRVARLVVAHECSMHVPQAIEGDERFLPYQRWASKLNASDAIVSFNYDLVVERILTDRNLVIGGLVNPVHPESVSGPKLFKMHGSIDWTCDAALDEVYKIEQTSLVGHAPVIGVPGASKYGLSRSPLFKDIWNQASAALKQASEIYIIGYSMPESDSFAISFLLDSLQQNTAPDLTVRLVLGQPCFTTERLREVLNLALGHRASIQQANESRNIQALSRNRTPVQFYGLQIQTLSAYAQDYLAAW